MFVSDTDHTTQIICDFCNCKYTCPVHHFYKLCRNCPWFQVRRGSTDSTASTGDRRDSF